MYKGEKTELPNSQVSEGCKVQLGPGAYAYFPQQAELSFGG